MRIALLDLDGTLCVGSSSTPLLQELIDVPGVRQDYLEAALRAANRDESKGPSRLRGGVYANYPRAVQGLPQHTVRDAALRAWPRMESMLLPFAHEVVEMLYAHSYEPILVTGCIREMADLVAEYLGIGQCFAADLDVRSGYLTSDFVHAPARAGEKQEFVLRLVEDRPEIDLGASLAMGNGVRDAEMMELVGIPVVFEPEKDLADLSGARGWPVVDRLTVMDHVKGIL